MHKWAHCASEAKRPPLPYLRLDRTSLRQSFSRPGQGRPSILPLWRGLVGGGCTGESNCILGRNFEVMYCM